jgi:hypothetical protein
MFKNLVSTVVVAGFLLTGVAVLAMDKGDKGGERGIIIIGGRVTAIKGNVITVKDNKGNERIFEIKSAEGIKIGAKAICEEDCGKGIKIGEKVIRIQKVLK